MNKRFIAIIAVGFTFLAIGFSTNKTFIGIGAAFILIGIVRGIADKKKSDDDRNN
jgi:hypothetical protein